MAHQITRREEQTAHQIRLQEAQTRPPVDEVGGGASNPAIGGVDEVEGGRGQPDPDGSGPVEADPAAAGFGRSGGVLRSAANKRETGVRERRIIGKRRKEREERGRHRSSMAGDGDGELLEDSREMEGAEGETRCVEEALSDEREMRCGWIGLLALC